ncbi:hypothetical protein BRX36_20440 [Sphingomonas sp. S-NIH.Pt1_0416]|nr:hypothetical protein BRX36_20440 [Sphingomonas sp. S-NIH.Pt1_0416]
MLLHQARRLPGIATIAVGRIEMVILSAGMATVGIIVVVGMVITLSTGNITAIATVIIITVVTTLDSMATSGSMGMIAAIISATKAATTTTAVTDLGSHPET